MTTMTEVSAVDLLDHPVGVFPFNAAEGMLKQSIPYISRSMTTMDAKKTAINVKNGTLLFRQDGKSFGVVRHDHRREDYITRLIEVDWNPDANAPPFQSFLKRILPIEAIFAFVQRFLGYAMTALDREQVFAIFHGEGRNGKSTLVEIISSIMNDYAASLPISSLVNDSRGIEGAQA